MNNENSQTTPRMQDYYRPTPGRDIGTWNVFHKNGDIDHDVPFDDLPTEIQDHLRSLTHRLRSQEDRKRTRLGDHRERAVPCQARRVNNCEHITWNIRAVCDACWNAEDVMGR